MHPLGVFSPRVSVRRNTSTKQKLLASCQQCVIAIATSRVEFLKCHKRSHSTTLCTCSGVRDSRFRVHMIQLQLWLPRLQHWAIEKIPVIMAYHKWWHLKFNSSNDSTCPRDMQMPMSMKHVMLTQDGRQRLSHLPEIPSPLRRLMEAEMVI